MLSLIKLAFLAAAVNALPQQGNRIVLPVIGGGRTTARTTTPATTPAATPRTTSRVIILPVIPPVRTTTATTTSARTTTTTSRVTTSTTVTSSATTSSSASSTTSASTTTSVSTTTSSTTTTTTSAAPTCVAGRVRSDDNEAFTVSCNTNLDGATAFNSFLGLANIQACIELCADDSRCNAVDFYRVDVGAAPEQKAGTCYLLSGIGIARNSDNRVDSAIRDCVPGPRQSNDGTLYNAQCNINLSQDESNFITSTPGVASLQACIQACDNYAPTGTDQRMCGAVDYYRIARGTGADQLAGNCILLVGEGTAAAAAADGVDSASLACVPGPRAAGDGTIYNVQCNVNLPINSLVQGPVGASNVQGCIQRCQNYVPSGTGTDTRVCDAVDFFRTAQGPGTAVAAGNCYLLSYDGAAGFEQSGVDSATLPCSSKRRYATDGTPYDVECNVNLSGDAPGAFLSATNDVASLQACIQICDGNSACEAVDFYRTAQAGAAAGYCALLTTGGAGSTPTNGIDSAIMGQ